MVSTMIVGCADEEDADLLCVKDKKKFVEG